MVNLNITAATVADLEVLREQLGRVPRGVVGIAHRCVCGKPTVVATRPRLEDGSPFPTTFYLSLPYLTKTLSGLEANQKMAVYQAELQADPTQLEQYQNAHQHYLESRQQIGEQTGIGQVEEIENVSAGGMPTRVKCLHALVGHALAAGKGINPIGDKALAELISMGKWKYDTCYCK